MLGNNYSNIAIYDKKMLIMAAVIVRGGFGHSAYFIGILSVLLA